jgi:serine/threonine protein kinase
MISFTCPSCGQKLKVKEDLAGKKGKCPHCKAGVSVPQQQAVSSGTTGSTSDSYLDMPTMIPANTEDEHSLKTLAPASGKLKGKTSSETLAPNPVTKTGDYSPELYDFLASAQAADEIGRLGEYRVLKILGAGAMGVVYLAEDVHLKRQVALKAMLPALASSETNRQRFMQEAQAIAAIDHDNIITIHRVAEESNIPFIAMQFLRGETLDDRLKKVKKLTIAEVLKIGRETAEGLAAAHARDVIHRDIKPANLWLEEEKNRVKILDFGLARATSSSSQLTALGSIMGTPAYMAPEQAAGKKVDFRVDLFSLGCVLYRIATGEAPFKGSDAISTLMAVAKEQPKPARVVNPEIPPLLSALIMHMLNKSPGERPASAKEVAQRLEMIENQPVETEAAAPVMPPISVKPRGPSALPPVMPPRMVQPIAGNPTHAVASAPSYAPPIPPAPAPTLGKMRPTHRPRDDDDEPEPRTKSSMGLILGIVGLLVVLAGGSVAAYLILNHPTNSWEVAGGSGGGNAGGGGKNTDIGKGPVALWTTFEERAKYPGEVGEMAISLDSRWVAFAQNPTTSITGAGEVVVKNLATKKLVFTLRGHSMPVSEIAFSPDGKKLVTGTGHHKIPNAQGELWIWDLTTRQRAHILTGHKGTVHSLLFNKDGSLLVVGDKQSRLNFFDMTAEPPRQTYQLNAFSNGITDIVFSPDGAHLAAGTGGQEIQIWDWQKRFKVQTLRGHTSYLHKVRYSPDGKFLLSGSGFPDNTFRLWDLSNPADSKIIHRHGNQVYGLSIHPSGKIVATGSGDRTIKIWSTTDFQLLHTIQCAEEIYDMEYTPDGTTLVAAARDGKVFVYK